MRIPEPLAESCDWLSVLAESTCSAGAGVAWSQDDSCAYYHGNWQYLRLLDLVSNPANHTDFYLDAFRRLAGQLDAPEVAVCGAADYSMLAHVHAALGRAARATVYELCPTPLLANDWYALRTGLPRPRGRQADVTAALPPDSYHIVVTDSFLPRIERDRLVPMLTSWRAALRDGGAVVTTVRIAVPGEENRQRFVDHFGVTVDRAAPWLASVTRRTADDLRGRLTSWVARREPTEFLAARDVAAVFHEAGFEKLDISERLLRSWNYVELVAYR